MSGERDIKLHDVGALPRPSQQLVHMAVWRAGFYYAACWPHTQDAHAPAWNNLTFHADEVTCVLCRVQP